MRFLPLTHNPGDLREPLTAEQIRAVFWDAYGRPEEAPALRFRERVYDAMHTANVLAEVARRGQREQIPQIADALRAALARFDWAGKMHDSEGLACEADLTNGKAETAASTARMRDVRGR